MVDFHKVARILSVLWIAAATTMMCANAQEPLMSESERRGLAGCLIKCPDRDVKCYNLCSASRNFKPEALGAIVRAPA
jgi:hypothetical protein